MFIRILILSLLSCAVAEAGDTDVDAIGRFDKKGALPPVRSIGALWDLSVPAEQWPALRAAAVAGPAAFDAHLAAAPWIAAAAKAKYVSLPAEFKEAVRQGALGLAP